MNAGRAWTAVVIAAAATTTLAADGPRAAADLDCVVAGAGPLLDCTVRLSRGGAPLQGANVTLGAAMPSMPMAHHVPPIAAAATGRPGEYRGLLLLAMGGTWTVQVDLAAGARERIVRTLDVPECDAARRCSARPAASLRPAAGPTH
ncbi:MAG: hypothetical protein NVS2B4_18800 [Ramlibacter sp.]